MPYHLSNCNEYKVEGAVALQQLLIFLPGGILTEKS